ncbi:MAG: four helix bundle protein [bacterium]
MRENILKSKSFLFAIRIVKLYKYLVENKKEFVMSKQLLKSGTSVGAMIREAEYAETKIDFKHKLGIAQKEINETIYWLELLKETDYMSKEQFDSIYSDADEIIRLITSSILTVKSSLKP